VLADELARDPYMFDISSVFQCFFVLFFSCVINVVLNDNARVQNYKMVGAFVNMGR
jgi:hypothetical protein